jgi:hypothetical protein
MHIFLWFHLYVDVESLVLRLNCVECVKADVSNFVSFAVVLYISEKRSIYNEELADDDV